MLKIDKYKHIKSDTPEGRKVFRHMRTSYDVINDLNLPDKATVLDECAEECGSVIVE